MTEALPDPAEWPVEDRLDPPAIDLLAARARETPDRTAMVDDATGERWSYGDLDASAGALATTLSDAAGLDVGRIGTLLGTGPGFVRTLFATRRLGASLAPLDVQRDPNTLRSLADRADVDVIVADDVRTDLAEDIAPQGATVCHPDATATGGGPEPPLRAADSEALLAFTSGTTGTPKGVRLTLENLVASATASGQRLDVDPDDRWLVPLPMYHLGGLSPVIRSTLYGTAVVLQAAFDAEATAAAIADHEVTVVSLVPTQLSRLLDAGWTPPGHLRAVLLGGAAASVELIDRCAERGVPVYPTYGTTETASQVATASPETAFAHPETVGHPLRGTEVTILDDGDPVGPGDVGEIAVAGPTVSPGYLDDERTDAAWGPHGFETGDRGYLDGDGRLFVVGRADDRIVSGGENVDPERVRAVLCDHPRVEDAAVVGLPDEEWGERVGAVVVGADVDRRDVESHCRAHLPPYAVPKDVRAAAALPRTASGTVDRERVVALLTEA